MSEFFRIVRGLEIDDSIRILQGAGAPGSSTDTNNAQRGSVYLDTNNGNMYTKIDVGVGVSKWSQAGTGSGGGGGTNLVLYSEAPSANPTTPATQGIDSIALGVGAQTTTTAPSSIAMGEQSVARHRGANVWASGRFTTSGDCQAGRYMLRAITVNGIQTEAFLDGTNGVERLVLPDDSTWTFTATVTAHRTDVGDGHAGYKIQGVVYRKAGANTITFQGAPTKTVLAESNIPWDINITTDTTNGSINAFVTGQTGKTIRWAILFETLEVTN
jgi:hypothetical protein